MRFARCRSAVAVAVVALGVLTAGAHAQSIADSPELYAGEKALYEAARKEGMVVSFDTGPTWANWAAQFAAFKKRYPEVEIVYNDIGSGATVVALDKARNRPQADTAYYFAASGIDAVAKNVVAPFSPVNFDKLTPVFRDPDGKWFTIHTLTVAFVVNTKLVKNVPQSWADLLKPEYRNTIVYLDPRSTGVGQVVSFAANIGMGGAKNKLQPGRAYFAHHPVRAGRLVLEREGGKAEQHFAQSDAAERRIGQIVGRRRPHLSEQLPHQAAAKCPGH